MSAIDDTRVLVTIDQGVADVRLNRPDKLNALDSAMFDALIATGDRLRTLPGLRAVVLSGVGKAFCAGLDMGRFQAMAGEADSAASLRLGPRSHGDCNVPQYAAMVWRSLPVPVIAAVHGAALGGGLQIALGADIRLVSPEAKLGLLEIRWGIIPDMGAFIVLPELMPADRIRDLAYTGRTVGGAEAVSMGLATQLSDAPLDTALAMARDIASRKPTPSVPARRWWRPPIPGIRPPACSASPTHRSRSWNAPTSAKRCARNWKSARRSSQTPPDGRPWRLPGHARGAARNRARPFRPSAGTRSQTTRRRATPARQKRPRTTRRFLCRGVRAQSAK